MNGIIADGMHSSKIHTEGCSTKEEDAFPVRLTGSLSQRTLWALGFEAPKREWPGSSFILKGGDEGEIGLEKGSAVAGRMYCYILSS